MADTLNDAIALMKSGKKALAHQIFEALIAADPRNVPAWLWDTGTRPTTEERVERLELCLQSNPSNAQVLQALTTLQSQLATDALLASQSGLAPPPPAAPLPARKESDFITLQCPNCSGKLAVVANAVSLKCEYCGMEHMIRREAGGVTLESYARCPVCNRNDRVEKVTAILRSQTQSAQSVAYRNHVSLVAVGNVVNAVNQQVAVPVESSQSTDLVKHLILPPQAPPPPPPPPAKTVSMNAKTAYWALWGGLGLGGVGALFLLIWLGIVWFGLAPSPGWQAWEATVAIWGAITLLPLIAAGLLAYLAIPREWKKNREAVAATDAERKKLQEQEQQHADNEMSRWNITWAQQTHRWKSAQENWNRLYYCGRDDCVFLPGKNTSAPIGRMVEYLGLQAQDIGQPSVPEMTKSGAGPAGAGNPPPQVQRVVFQLPAQPAPSAVYRSSKSRGVAILLAFFLGGLGLHKFYLGEYLLGILYLVFCATFIPLLLSLLDCVVLLFMSENSFARKYG